MDKDTIPITGFFRHAGEGAGAIVFLLEVGFCSRGGAEGTGGGPLFRESEGLGGPGTVLVGFFWMGHCGDLMGGGGTGGGGPFGW